MKLFKWSVPLVLCAGIFTACNKEDNSQLSPEAEEARILAAMYPNAQNVRWEKEDEYLVAEFINNGSPSEAWFLATKWRYTEIDIPYSALPQPVRTAFEASSYAQWVVEDIDMVERDGTTTFYVIEAERGELDVELYYTPAGVLIKTITEPHHNSTAQYVSPLISATALANIKTYLDANYPNAIVLEYELEDGYIEVDILDGTVHRVLIFSYKGEWINTYIDDGEDDFDYDDDAYENDIPENIKALIISYVNAHYPNATILSIERESNGTYEVEIRHNKIKYDLYFDAQGNFINAHIDDK